MNFTSIIRAKWTMDGSKTLKEAAENLEGFAKLLREMDKDGIILQDTIDDDYGFIETDNKEIADKWGLTEDEDFDENEEDTNIDEVTK